MALVRPCGRRWPEPTLQLREPDCAKACWGQPVSVTPAKPILRFSVMVTMRR